MKTERIADSEDHITKEAVSHSTASLINPGAVLIVTRSGILRHTLPVAVSSVVVTVNQDLKALSPRNGIMAEYVAWALRAFGRDILNTCSKQGTTVNSVETAKLLRFEIPVAPTEQQRSIVAEIEKQFSRLDEAVANLKRVKANLKRYKAAVLRAAVEGKLTEDWRKQHPDVEPASKLLERILTERRVKWKGRGEYNEPAEPGTTNMPKLPKGWVWATIAQIADVASGNTPSGVLHAVRQTGEIPWFKVGDMNHDENQHVMRHADAWLSVAEVKGLGLRLFQPNTVLFPKRGGAIATNKKRRLESPGCADLNVMGITLDYNIASYFFTWFDGVDLGRLSDGSNVPQINHKDIEPLVVPLPPLAEQQAVVPEVERRLSVIDELEATVEANLTRADRLRQSVLSQAFSGRLIGQDTKHIPDILPTFSIAAESQARYGKDSRAGR
jgi:type I restriction enzyme S subunit